MKWFVIPKEMLPQKNAVTKIHINQKNWCLIREDDQWFVTSLRCPHAGADLSQGWCEDKHLVCPYHRHAFDLHTGKGLPGQGNYIRTYPVKWENDQLWVQLPNPWWKW
jgi:nitrite reductase/ring-hydroxylating ferredoxin subunit